MVHIYQDSLQGCLKPWNMFRYWCDKGVLWERHWFTSRRMSQHIWYATCAMKIHEDCWQWRPIMKKQEQKVWKRSLILRPCLHFSTPPNNPEDTVRMRLSAFYDLHHFFLHFPHFLHLSMWPVEPLFRGNTHNWQSIAHHFVYNQIYVVYTCILYMLCLSPHTTVCCAYIHI